MRKFFRSAPCRDGNGEFTIGSCASRHAVKIFHRPPVNHDGAIISLARSPRGEFFPMVNPSRVNNIFTIHSCSMLNLHRHVVALGKWRRSHGRRISVAARFGGAAARLAARGSGSVEDSYGGGASANCRRLTVKTRAPVARALGEAGGSGRSRRESVSGGRVVGSKRRGGASSALSGCGRGACDFVGWWCGSDRMGGKFGV